MSRESEVMKGAKSMIDFIKSKTVSNLIEASNTSMIEVDKNTLEKITRLVDDSIQSAFILASKEITDKL